MDCHMRAYLADTICFVEGKDKPATVEFVAKRAEDVIVRLFWWPIILHVPKEEMQEFESGAPVLS